jgi:hypothetical protein
MIVCSPMPSMSNIVRSNAGQNRANERVQHTGQNSSAKVHSFSQKPRTPWPYHYRSGVYARPEPTPHNIFKLRQTAPVPTYLSKLQSNISRPEMHLEHSFYPWNLQREPSFRRSRITEPGMVREDMSAVPRFRPTNEKWLSHADKISPLGWPNGRNLMVHDGRICTQKIH